MIEHDDALGPSPQEHGFPENPSVVNQQCWDRQQAFLKAFGQLGTIRAAARTIGIHRDTVNKWLSADLYSFKKRMADAKEEYREFLEDLIHERLTNPQGNRGSDVLLMFREKAEWPEKYREEVKVLGVQAPIQLLDQLRELGRREQQALEAPAVEGEFREVGPLEEKSPPVSERSDITRGESSSRLEKPGGVAPSEPRSEIPEPAKKPKREPGWMKRR
jgi:hypothetical protein